MSIKLINWSLNIFRLGFSMIWILKMNPFAQRNTSGRNIVVKRQVSNFSAISWPEQVTIFQLYHGENKLQFFSYIMARTSYNCSVISWPEQITIFQLYHGENKLQFFSYIIARTSYNFLAISWPEQITIF